MRCLRLVLSCVIAGVGCGASKGLAPPPDAAAEVVAAPPATPDASVEVEPEAAIVVDAGVEVAPEVVSRVPYKATAIALGQEHACALLDDHRVKCWGSNDYGQLGLGDRTKRNDAASLGDVLPTVDLGTGRTAVSLAAGRYTSCAKLDDGSFKCWGWTGLTGAGASGNSRTHGLEPGTMGDALPGLDLGAGRTVRQAVLALYRGFGLLDDGSVKEWDAIPPAEIRPASAMPPVAALSTAGGSGVALFADGTITLLDVKVGGGDAAAQEIADLPKGERVRAIGGNDGTFCLALEKGGLRCNDGISGVTSSSFSAVATTATWGGRLACGLRDDGRVMCWFNSTATPWWAETPTVGAGGWLVALGQPATAISAGALDMCALLADGTVKCWNTGVGPITGLAAGTPTSEWLPVDLGSH